MTANEKALKELKKEGGSALAKAMAFYWDGVHLCTNLHTQAVCCDTLTFLLNPASTVQNACLLQTCVWLYSGQADKAILIS